MSRLSPPPSPELDLPDPEATAAVARWIAPQVGAGDSLLLHGPIGAGKTHFARALILHRLAMVGLAEDVPSPTYTLVQTYQAGDLTICHADLYRITHPDDVLDLGFGDGDPALWLIEWPERLGAHLPPDGLNLRFSPAPADQRRLAISATAARWAGLLAGLSAR